jgi:hypothetical protein
MARTRTQSAERARKHRREPGRKAYRKRRRLLEQEAEEEARLREETNIQLIDKSEIWSPAELTRDHVPLSSYDILPEHDAEPVDITTMPRPGYDKESSFHDVQMSLRVVMIESFLSLCTFCVTFGSIYACWIALWMLWALFTDDEEAVTQLFSAENGAGRRRIGLL